jgi:hypothetical protein
MEKGGFRKALSVLYDDERLLESSAMFKRLNKKAAKCPRCGGDFKIPKVNRSINNRSPEI